MASDRPPCAGGLHQFLKVFLQASLVGCGKTCTQWDILRAEYVIVAGMVQNEVGMEKNL